MIGVGSSTAAIVAAGSRIAASPVTVSNPAGVVGSSAAGAGVVGSPFTAAWRITSGFCTGGSRAGCSAGSGIRPMRAATASTAAGLIEVGSS